MSNEAPVEPEAPAQEPEADTPPEIDWKAQSRKWEAQAKQNKAAAEKLAALEESQKTAEQKAADALAAAQAKVAEADAKILRRDVALEHKLTADDAALLDTITDEAAMRSLAARLAPAPDSGPRAPRPDANQGKPGQAAATPADEFAAFLQGQLGQ
jgi:hypothetical protein